LAPELVGYALKTINTSFERGIMVEVPYQSQYNFLSTSNCLALNTPRRFTTNGTLLITFETIKLLISENYSPTRVPDFSPPLVVTAYIAAGEDFRYHFPISPRPLTNIAPAPYYPDLAIVPMTNLNP